MLKWFETIFNRSSAVQNQNTTKRREPKDLSLPERRVIEQLNLKGKKKIEIAELLGVHRSTIGRELNDKNNWDYKRVSWFRGRKHVVKTYCADKAHANYLKARKKCGAKIKHTKDKEFLKEVEKRFWESGDTPQTRYSLDAIIGEMNSESKILFTSKTMYNYIRAKNITKIKPHDLPHMVSRKRNRKKIDRVNKRILGTSIEERPEIINKREEFGHWEGDCIVDGVHTALLIKYERLSRKVVIRKLDKHDKASVELIESLFRKTYFELSATYDNGSEFWDRAKHETETYRVYFTHPSSPYEKGGVENVNGIIRRYIPKGTRLETLTDSDIQRIEDHINNMPRKILGYKTANNVYAELLPKTLAA